MATHREVLQWLENELFDGHLVLGQRLPTDKDMAAIFRVSRNSMREALKILEAQGIVKLFEGPHRSILPILVREPAASAGPALQLHMATSEHPLRDIVQTRVLLETAALHASEQRWIPRDELLGIMTEMDREDLGLKQFHDLYVSFHIALVKSCGNAVSTALFTALRDSIYEYTMALVGHVPLWSTTSSRIRAEHRAIVGALDAGDRTLAARLVREHIEYQYEEAGVDPDQARSTAADPHALGDAAASPEPAAEDDELSAAPRASA
ncbi:FadR/GntR family transcriptional regulator [Kocuria rhizophila]|uniref:FadR/GntR family transcriptional regulator n=1 Tax=Kocuria rhizophila TaxID=72000 RepID=UPI0021A51E38|nr:FCD domain-containing protein [Kocuria rhizophila]MCT1916155.1 FCD domain-containing protein [Kocuria rhizophila]